MNTTAATTPDAAPAEPSRDVVLVTGISGSGKSVALHALEDAGFYCVDNLPPELLPEFLRLERGRTDRAARRLAIGVDVRSAGSLPRLLPLLKQLVGEGVAVRSIFLDASTDALMRRFSETRRRHPLSDEAPATPHVGVGVGAGRARDADATAAIASGDAATGAPAADHPRALVDAIELERQLLAGLREVCTVIDTSTLRPAQLRGWVRQLVQAPAGALTLVFESFAFKNGVPLDADYVFDVRVLPNPHYVRELQPLTGRDAPVAAYLAQQPEVTEMLGQIETFLARWLPAFEQDQRAYLTVAIGCTGGQHRSVYFVEQLARRFRLARGATLVRHRELGAR